MGEVWLKNHLYCSSGSLRSCSTFIEYFKCASVIAILPNRKVKISNFQVKLELLYILAVLFDQTNRKEWRFIVYYKLLLQYNNVLFENLKKLFFHYNIFSV